MMTTLESTIAIAVASALTLGTLELAEMVEHKAMSYNEAVQIQAQCYKARDFKCAEAKQKFNEVRGAL